MSNSLNSNPIAIDTDLTTSWRAQQTLNPGLMPATVQNPNPTFRQPGVKVTEIKIVANASTAAGQLAFVDPNDNTVLYPPVVIPATQATGTVIFSDIMTFPLNWRDFKITGVTAAHVTVYIWYRN